MKTRIGTDNFNKRNLKSVDEFIRDGQNYEISGAFADKAVGDTATDMREEGRRRFTTARLRW